MAGLVTIPNVEIASTGTWEASNGTFTFTTKDLQAAIAACDDPAVKEPRLIIGHTDGAIGPGMSPQEGFFGEQPSLGRFTNLRMADNNQTLVGDLMGVPEWLAEIMPTAYPNRSIEGYWDVVSATGKEHQFVIPRVAILGVNLPAVATLEDLQAMFSEEGPEGVTFTKVGARVAASKGNPPKQVAASVQYEDVRRDFYNDFAKDDRYWWWIRAVYVDPPVLIVDDDEGGLWSVPYSVAGDSAEFGDPVQVITQYVEKDSPTKVVATRPTATGQNYTKAESRPADRNRPNKEKEAKMARVTASIDVSALRQRLGLTEEQLPDSATEEQINEAITTGTVGTSPDPNNTANPEQAEPGTPEAGALEPGEPSEGGTNRGTTGPGDPNVNASGVTVDAEQWRQTQEDARAGREARAQQLRSERETFVTAAINDGRIPPSRRDHYLSLMSRDDAGTREFLANLQPGSVVPTGEVGHEESVDASASAYVDTHLSPEERARITAAQAGQYDPTQRIITEA
jgi:hypothetical protein